jgi:hypothetical protein
MFTAGMVCPPTGPTLGPEEYEIQAMHSRRIAASSEAAE